MKKVIVILTVAFLACFAGKSDARGYYGGRGGCYRGVAAYRGACYRGYCGPRVYAHPYYCAPRFWVAGYWGWDYWHRWVWFPGYWR